MSAVNQHDSEPVLPKIVSKLKGLDDDEQSQLEQQKKEPSNKGAGSMHWILHWDINETILVGDESGGDTREDCFNKIIAKSAFVQMTPTTTNNDDDEEGAIDYDTTSAMTPTHWWDGTPLLQTNTGTGSSSEEQKEGTPPPPLYTGWDWPEGCCPYYRTSYKKISKTFVHNDGHGTIYKPLYDEMERRLTSAQQDNSPFKNIIPAFFRTLYQLVHNNNNNKNPPVTIVFRTFGTDLPSIAQAMTAFARGEHPDYPDFIHPEYELDTSRLYYAKWIPQDDKSQQQQGRNKELYQYQLFRQDDNTMVASGDQQVLDLLHGNGNDNQQPQQYVFGIQDDYPMWKSHNWEPWAGKPVWKTPPKDDDSNKRHHHHILLDDNIHNLAHDGIASVRQQATVSGDCFFESLSGSEIQAMHGIHLIRVPTVEPIMNTDWFLQQIERVQEAALRAREKVEWS